MRILLLADRLVARLELLLAIAAMTGLVLILVAQVVFRYVLAAPLFFAEEVALLLLIVASFAGLSLLVAHRRLVAVDMVGTYVAPSLHRWIQWLTGLVVLATGGLLAWYALLYLSVPWVWFERSATLPMPRAALYCVVAAELVALCFHQAVQSIAGFPPLARQETEA